MLPWLLDMLPWWIVPALGLVALLVAFILLRAFGVPLRTALVAMATLGVSVLAMTIYQKGRRAGVRSQLARMRRADEAARRTRSSIESTVGNRGAKDNRNRLWTRPHGF